MGDREDHNAGLPTHQEVVEARTMAALATSHVERFHEVMAAQPGMTLDEYRATIEKQAIEAKARCQDVVERHRQRR